MAEKYPDRYARPDGPSPRVEGPGEHPERWVGDIYPGRKTNERPNNCGECARAVDSTWHGTPAAAAELASRRIGGERPSVMTEWAGRSSEKAPMAEIERRLRQLGPGSSAVVGFDRAGAPGHWVQRRQPPGHRPSGRRPGRPLRKMAPVQGRTRLR